MVSIKNDLGELRITTQYLFELIKYETVSCFGVDSLNKDKNGKDDKSIKFSCDGTTAEIEIHICVTYGLNITAIVTNIESKVKNSVEALTGLSVENVKIYVDSININK